jgi:hypothetical protein
MATISTASRRLKQLRRQANVSIREMAEALHMPYGSSYQHYEDRFKKPFLPLDLVTKLASILNEHGVPLKDIYALAGLDGTGETPSKSNPSTVISYYEDSVRIEEIDLRNAANLEPQRHTETQHWRMPRDLVRTYRTTPETELKIANVIGDSMEPTLIPGQRLLIDIGDRFPSPPGIFIVHDGSGLVIKRVQIVPHDKPVKVKVTSDNVKYDGYECPLEEANIQGRVIGQWRWL